MRSIRFWAGIGLSGFQLFQNFRIKNGTGNPVRAAGPFAEVDFAATFAAKREIRLTL